MKKLILFASIILLATSCNSHQQGLQESVYGNSNDTNEPVNDNGTTDGQTTTVKVAVIAVDDAGRLGKKIGCNDSVVFSDRVASQTSQPLNEAMKQLFNLNSVVVEDGAYKTELYNALYLMQKNSDSKNALQFDHAATEGSIAKIYLTGSTDGLGGVCDSPRVPAQIEETAKQFPAVRSVETYLNNKRIDWQAFSSQK